MATKRIVINVQDNVTDALIKSQNVRIKTLESLIKKKAKKKDVSSELRELGSLKKLVSSQSSSFDKKSNAMLAALEKSAARPFRAQIVPYPA